MKKLIYLFILCLSLLVFSNLALAEESGDHPILDLVIGGAIGFSPDFTGLSEDLIKLDAGTQQTYFNETYGGATNYTPSGATMGLGADIYATLEIYQWFFFKTGFTYNGLIMGGSSSLEVGYDYVNAQGLAVTMDNAQQTLEGAAHAFKIPMVVGIHLPVTSSTSIYVGLGPCAYIGWLNISGKVNANYINMSNGALVASADATEAGTVQDRDYDIKWYTAGIGIQYMIGFEQEVFVDGLSLSFMMIMDTYSAIEDNKFADTPQQVNPIGGDKAIDASVIDNFDELTGSKVNRYMAPNGESRAQFPISFSGLSFYLGVSYKISLM